MQILISLARFSLKKKPLFLLLLASAGCHLFQNDNKEKQQNDISKVEVDSSITTSLSANGEDKADVKQEKVDIFEIKEGDGPTIEGTSKVSVHYRGMFPDGREFDSSYKRGKPFVFTCGEEEVIAGWEMGLIGMRQGGKRKIVIPPSFAYGDRGISGIIPPEATLVFEIEALKVSTSNK